MSASAAIGGSSGGSLLGKIAGAAAARAKAARKPSRTAAFLKDHLLTACALGAGVAAAFLHGDTWGLGSMVPALLILDYKLRG